MHYCCYLMIRLSQALQCMISYVVLAPYDNEQSDMMHRIQDDKNLEHMPAYRWSPEFGTFDKFLLLFLLSRKLLKSFLTEEIIQWKGFVTELEKDLRQGTKDLPSVYVLRADTDGGLARWEHLLQRVIEHNIRVMAMYYSKVSLTRLAQLLSLTTLESEEYIGKLVSRILIRYPLTWARCQVRHNGCVSCVRACSSQPILVNWPPGTWKTFTSTKYLR